MVDYCNKCMSKFCFVILDLNIFFFHFISVCTEYSDTNPHQTVNYRENDLVIVCSITIPLQLRFVFYIELLKNSSTTFDSVVSVVTGKTPLLQWTDTALQSWASATGSIESPRNALLRLTIDKASVRCPTDFKM